MVVNGEQPCVDGGPGVCQQVSVREHRAKRPAGHRRGVDDRRLLVPPGCVGLSGELETHVCAQIHGALGALVDERCGSGCVVEQHARHTRRKLRGELRVGEHRADVGIVKLVQQLERRCQRIQQHAAAALAGRKGNEVCGAGGKEHCCTMPREGANQRRASAEQREPRSDELPGFEFVDSSAVRSCRKRHERKRVAHNSNRAIALLSRVAISAR